MERKVLARIGRLFGTVFLILSATLAQAKPGLDHQFSQPHYADESLQLDVLDLQVQALGGPIRMLRTWKGGKWVWNERWEDLEVLGPADPKAPQGASDPLNVERPYAVLRGGQSYLRAGSTVQGQDVTFNNLPQRTLTALQRGLAGYRWENVQGERSDYDSEGRMTGYRDRNGVQVSLVRNTEGQIEAIKDHHGDTLITLAYTAGNLTSARDYSGREVKYEYSNGRLSAVTDVLGQRWQYHYDANGLAGYTDPLSQRTTYVLGKKDSLQEYRLPDGRWTKYSYGYDQATELFYVRRVDEGGLVREQWFDRLGHLVREQEAGEILFTRQYLLSDGSSDVSKIAEAYRISGKSLAVTKETSQRQGRTPAPYVAQMIEQDAQGNRTITEFNRYNQDIRVQYPDGSETRKSYDPATGNVAEQIDQRGHVTRYRYDAKGNLIELIKAAGTPDALSVRFRRNALGQTIEEIHPTDEGITQNNWTYGYDAKGNLESITDSLGHETRYRHDVLGKVVELTNALDHRWMSTYDGVGNLKSIVTPLGHETLYRYDKLGQLIEVEAANGSITQYKRNAAGQLKSIIDAANAQVTFEYDASQQLVAEIDPLGNRSELQYDVRGRLQGNKDPVGNQTTYHYEHERISGVDYPTFKLRYQYDALDRLTEQTLNYTAAEGPRSERNQNRYFRNGLLEQALDAADNATRQAYNALDQLVELEDAEGGITRFSYDKRGNLAQVTDPAGRITNFRYDARDALITETRVGDASTPTTERRFEYDKVGNLSRAVTPDGRVSRYRYDADNRLVEQLQYPNAGDEAANKPEHATQYGYNALGQLELYEDQQSRGKYGYNDLGQLTSATITYKTANPVFSKNYTYTYDANGRPETYTNPEQQTYIYRYTAHGQLAGVSIPGEGSISYQDFAWLQPQQLLYPGGSALDIVYDGLLRDSRRTLKDPAGNLLLQHRYQHDAVGNITGDTSDDGAIQYGYDKLSRLTEVTYPQGDRRPSEAYAYDGVGNRLDAKASKAELDIGQWQYNAHNQLISQNGIGYRYNAGGHLVEKGALQTDNSLKQSGEIDHWRYGYDSRERLVRVEKNGQLVAQYAYNPLGQRISKTLPQQGQTLYYLYSREGLVAEYDASGNLRQEYAYDPTAAWMSKPLFTRAQRQDSGQWSVSYFGTSHLGTPEIAFEKSGQVTWRAEAKAFGEASISQNSIDNPLRLPGQYFDAETGLHYNYFRDYDPSLGRYLQSDPLRLGGGLNSYGYAYQDPISLMDPTGEIVPIVVGYARCVASCKLIAMAEAAITGECDDTTLGDCMVDCLNPLKWFKIGKMAAHGGGKNAKHANQKRREAAAEKYEATKSEYERLKSQPNKTKDVKEALEKAKRAMDKAKQDMDFTGEHHSSKHKGNR